VADMLCTLADVKTMLNIPLEDASKDGKLNLLIKQYSALIQAYVGYRFARAEYVDELQCENNRQVIYCNHFPIQSVQSVEVGNKSISDFKLLPEYSVWGGLYRGLGWGDKCFTRGFTHDAVGGVWDVKVSYTAGYYLPDDENYTEGAEDSLPYDIVAVCINCVVEKYNLDATGAIGLKSHSEGHVSDTFSDSASNPGLSDSAKAALSRFVRYGVA
jgi:hypothetical protein